jgi:hypothetical protein
MVVAAGATDTYASRWIMRATMDLLVLPFHLHRGDGGRVLDAIGVLLSLPEDVDLGGLTVLMPVRAFSWGSSFQRRLELLRETRPHIASELLIAHQDELGSPVLASRLRRAHARPPSTAPLVRSASVAPPTLRDLPAPNPVDYEEFSAEDAEHESAHFEVTREPTVSGMQLRRRRTDPPKRTQSQPRSPPHSQPPGGSRSSAPPAGGRSTTAPPSSDSERSSRILPTGGDTAESARESFRRAAEIGAKARQDVQSRKKGK